MQLLNPSTLVAIALISLTPAAQAVCCWYSTDCPAALEDASSRIYTRDEFVPEGASSSLTRVELTKRNADSPCCCWAASDLCSTQVSIHDLPLRHGSLYEKRN